MVTPNPFQNLIISFAPGERVFTEGEVGTTMFIVQSGRVRLFRETGGKGMAIAEMEKGDFFGEMSLLEATPRNMSAEAIDMVELIEINSTTFDRMIRSNIEIAVRMLRKLSGRLQKAESLLAQRLVQPAEREMPAPAPSPAAAAAAAVPKVDRPPQPSVPPRAAGPRPVAGKGARTIAAVPPATEGSGAAAMVAAAAPVPAPAAAPSAPRAPGTASGSLSATRPPAAAAIPFTTAAATSAATATATAARPAAQAAARGVMGQGARLVSETGETIFPVSQGEALVGRYDPVTETQPEVDLTLIDIKRSVSRRHARITSRDGLYYLTEEVGALNGTFVNGVKLITGKPAPLNNEDRVSLGTVNLVFRS